MLFNLLYKILYGFASNFYKTIQYLPFLRRSNIVEKVSRALEINSLKKKSPELSGL